MSDEPISQAPIQDITSTDVDTEENGEKSSSPQIFDITPDLNISPAKDEIDNTPPVVIPDNILDIKTPQPSKNPTPTPIQPQFGPANPPAKTIGIISNKIPTQQNTQTKPSTLQEAVSSIKIEKEIPQKPLGSLNIPQKPIPDKPWETKPNSIIKPLRTYETDFAEAMSKKRISTSSLVIAEDKRKQNTENLSNSKEISNKDIIDKYKSHATRNWILSIISLILICGGGFAGYYLYLRSPVAPVIIQNSTTAQNTLSKSIIPSDSKVVLSIDNKNANSILSQINSEINKQQNEKTIKEIVLSKTINTEVKKVSANEMLSLAEISPPDLITRSLSSDWMLGVYANSSGLKNPFVITTNIFFQNTFAGIIQWEKTMPNDLKQYLYSGSAPISTTSDIVIPDFTTRGQYKDRIIKNRDVREYIAENGHIIFLYSFISNDKLVITNDEEALEEIIVRLEKNAFLR